MANKIIAAVALANLAIPAGIAALSRLSGRPPPGGVRPPPQVPGVNLNSTASASTITDTRVRIKVPRSYITELTKGTEFKELEALQGIVFPFTPQISYEHKADYTPLNPMHSNHPIYFYQRSSVTPITITGKFSVQNDDDAAIYISSVHLLRALTKMRHSNEEGAGSPPPVCRLYGHGLFSLDNVPVAISNVRIEYPESVDYYTIGTTPRNNSRPNVITKFGQTSVPTLSTISVTCIPMYSRTEMQKFKVTDWLGQSDLRKSGLL